MTPFPFAGETDDGASAIAEVCRAERERQWRKLIMIPSESICHPAAADVLSCDLGNIYAEGKPQPILCHDPEDSAFDPARFESWRTRLSDKRFYKGTVGADRVELIAHECISKVFASLAGSPDVCDIHVNVQALSGAAANLAVYDALLAPGDGLMGLDLSHGGHLTHGSEFNFSGKTYRVHAYGVDETTRRLDYDRIREDARRAGPRLIIGGASSYSWDFDWAALRAIADDVGAYLLADIAHLAGMVAAGVLANPLPHAHVVTFTTHKTLCGPRGAVILSTDPEIARLIDASVFPGFQGGPHMNSIAAIGRLFELILADYDAFCRFQREMVSNTAVFAERLVEEGFTLEYGGTNTHMVLVDLKQWPVHGETPLDGEIASRLLEIAGIVCNKNVIPGDLDGAHASGLRFGLPWLTQRGITEEHLREIARIMRSVLAEVHTTTVYSPLGDRRCRGRVAPGVLAEAAERAFVIAEALPYPPRPPGAATPPPAAKVGDRAALLLRGDKVRLALSEMLTARLTHDRAPVHARMLRNDGSAIDDVVVAELPRVGREERWVLAPHADREDDVRRWIETLSDGYLLFDEDDLQKKVDGPCVVERLDVDSLPTDLVERIKAFANAPACDPTKPWFIGQKTVYAETKPAAKRPYEVVAPELPLRKTPLNQVHRDLGARLAPFAGWEMPIEYPTGIPAEHQAVRTAAGLFDVSHMRAIEVSGAHAPAFLETLLANCVSRLDPGQAQYSYLLYPDGTAVDDLTVYRRERDRFMLVANAANAERVLDWMRAVNSREVVIDDQMPAKAIDGPVEIRDLHDAGDQSLVGLALQGPMSRRVLMALAESRAQRAMIERLAGSAFVPVQAAGVHALVARTGYTGEPIGYETYVHPESAVRLWNALLDAGRPMGVLPAGLGARDSTRVEAGLPLFGHELEGDLAITLTEAGYGFIVRLHVPFFIGRDPYMKRAARSRRHVIRLHGQGRKTVRPGHVILDPEGGAAGEVTSFAYVHEDKTFVALACVREDFTPEPGEAVTGARVPAGKLTPDLPDRALVHMTALPRFLEADERSASPEVYA